MTLRLSFAALALALTPGLAAAMCSDKTPVQTTASVCAEGQVWDAGTQACVLKPAS